MNFPAVRLHSSLCGMPSTTVASTVMARHQQPVPGMMRMRVRRYGECGKSDAEWHECGAVPPRPPADRFQRDQAERFVRAENDELKRVITVAPAHRAARAAHLTPVRVSPGHYDHPGSLPELPVSGNSLRR